MDGFAESFARTLAARRVVGRPRPGMVHGLLQRSGPAGLRPPRGALLRLRPLAQLGARARPGPTAYTRSPAAPTEVATTSPNRHRSTTSTRSCATSTTPASSWRWYTYDVGTLRCVDSRLPARAPRALRVRRQAEASVDDRARGGAGGRRGRASFIEERIRGGNRAQCPGSTRTSRTSTSPTPSRTTTTHPPTCRTARSCVFMVYNALASGPALGEDAAARRLRRARRLPRPRRRPPRRPTTTRHVRALRRPGAGARRLPVGRSALGLAARCSTTPRSSRRSSRASAPIELEPDWSSEKSSTGSSRTAPHYMGKRVAEATDLGELLTERSPRPAPGSTALVEWMTQRQAAIARESWRRAGVVQCRGPRVHRPPAEHARRRKAPARRRPPAGQP